MRLVLVRPNASRLGSSRLCYAVRPSRLSHASISCVYLMRLSNASVLVRPNASISSISSVLCCASRPSRPSRLCYAVRLVCVMLCVSSVLVRLVLVRPNASRLGSSVSCVSCVYLCSSRLCLSVLLI